MKFKDNGEQIFYLERYGNICVIRKAKKEKKVLSPAEEAKKQNMRKQETDQGNSERGGKYEKSIH